MHEYLLKYKEAFFGAAGSDQENNRNEVRVEWWVGEARFQAADHEAAKAEAVKIRQRRTHTIAGKVYPCELVFLHSIVDISSLDVEPAAAA